jgi:hypothetical protein
MEDGVRKEPLELLRAGPPEPTWASSSRRWRCARARWSR